MVYHRSEGGGGGRPRQHRHSRDEDRYHARGSRSWEGEGEAFRPSWDNAAPRGYQDPSGGRIPDRFVPHPPPMFNNEFRFQPSGQFNPQVGQFSPDTYPHYRPEPEPPKPVEDKSKQNVFQNDGSFLEMFKKMQDGKPPAAAVKVECSAASVSGVQDAAAAASAAAPTAAKKPAPLPMVGKRRGGRVLKTGLVKKLKIEKPEDKEPKNAWSMYMNEVRKYKEASCEEEGKTRPLVK